MADRKANQEHMQQMMAKTETDQEQIMAEMRTKKQMMDASQKEMMDANQAKADDNLMEMRQETRSGQVEIKSTLSAIEEKMEAWKADMKACEEAMEPNPEKLEHNPENTEENPVEMTSVVVHEEFHTEDAAVGSSGTVRMQHRGRHVAAGRCGEPGKLT
jgi:chromosome segregation ATPase